MLQYSMEIGSVRDDGLIESGPSDERIKSRLLPNPDLSRAIVSTQDNSHVPGFRWFRYREGFSWSLMEYLLSRVQTKGKRLIDPFAGAGTAPFAITSLGGSGLGIEIMPVGVVVANAIAESAKVDRKEFRKAGNNLLRHIERKREPAQQDILKHIRITHKAFTPDAERDIALVRGFLRKQDDSPLAKLLSLACMSVLEPCRKPQQKPEEIFPIAKCFLWQV